jgi:uncharacterized protein YlaN (UPF0358 family)
LEKENFMRGNPVKLDKETKREIEFCFNFQLMNQSGGQKLLIKLLRNM